MTPTLSPAPPPDTQSGAPGRQLALRAGGVFLVVAATASVVVVAMQAGS